METLEVTDEQYAIVQQLREEIGEHVVGKYGHVRERDAVQFLIDNLHDGLELEPGAAADGDEVGASVDDDPNLQTVSYDEAESVDDAVEGDALETADESAVDPEGSADRDSTTEPTLDGAEGASAPSGDRLAGTPGAPTDDASDDRDPSDGEDGDGADDDEMLDEMMALLETHDDKWAEASSADFRYTVTLPDGSTESVQTKDDVRALLFRHYR
ncbi:hypothetical protein [Natronococcus jeotgali]|uniref:Uncharacterized protein n=1 Tax=Natronococcus jeotgali DSM 18795 TaxID=1227498 RepID=L9WWD2_9EURY|nr:hypothetical protein [Natronococcus jeotgali]ELY53722.1 hypothetical protein C492_17228 [Natronococcus jeotgali DSM 18795]